MLFCGKTKIFIIHNGFPGLVAAVLGKLMDVKVILSEGNTLPWVNPYISSETKNKKLSWDLLVGKLISKLSDGIRVQSVLIKKSMIKNGVDPKKIRVIYGGVDIDIFKPKNFKPKNKFSNTKLGYLGRLKEEKGVHLLLEIVKLASKELPDIRFIIMGDGDLKNDFSNLNNVEHIGFIKRDKLPKCISKVDIFLFFNKQLGLAEAEVMSEGKILIAPDIGEISLHIKNLKNGILCQPNARSYIQAIQLVYDNNLLLKQISKNSRDHAVKNYSWKTINDNWFELCMAVLE